jgi:Ser-tRNA(Ala) deacylase AlaX
MNTLLKYMQNAFLYEDQAIIQEIIPLDDGRTSITLDQTIFYPQGGGQPYDQGTISSENAVFNVEEVRFVDSIVKHIGSFQQGALKVNDQVNLKIDRERRTLNTKLHTAGHLIDEAARNLGYLWKPTKGMHYPESSFVEYEGSLGTDQPEKTKEDIEKEVNHLIQEGFEVKTFEVNRDELPKYCDEIQPYLPKDKPCRIAIVWGEKGIPCGGIHVKNVNDLGHIHIRKIVSKKRKIKISYEL